MNAKTLLVLTSDRPSAEEIAAMAQGSIVVVVSAGLGGAWTERADHVELVLFGHPRDSRNSWFVYHDYSGEKHNALSLAIERMIYARQVGRVVVLDPRLDGTARRGLLTYGDAIEITVRDKQQSGADFLRSEIAGEPAGERAQ